MDEDMSEEDPFQLLLGLRDGRTDEDDCDFMISEPYASDSNNQSSMEYEVSPSFSLDKLAGLDFKTNTNKKKLTQRSIIRSMHAMTFEEQKETEEPVEIDLRNVCKTYGINPIDSRQKLFKKQSNDIINFSIGEAYMKFAHGKNDEAINLLIEVIRMNPMNPEPYDALGDIYCKMGNFSKALEFYLLGIEFNESDSKRWADLAELACLNRMYKSALQFYSKAIKLNQRNVTYYIKKSNLYEQLKQFENAYKTSEKLLSLLEPTDYKIILSIGFRISEILHHHLNCPEEAMQVIETILDQHEVEQNLEKFESFQLYLPSYFDLILANGCPEKVVLKFMEYNLLKNVSIKGDDENLDELETISVVFDRFQELKNEESVDLIFKTDSLVLRSKLFCSFLYLNRFEIFSQFFLNQLQKIDSEYYESVYRPIVPALIQLGQHEIACDFVLKLVEHYPQCSKYWFWCGLCQRRMSDTDQAIISYENSIQHDPNNYDAVRELSDLCNQMGFPERALDNVNLDLLKVNLNLLVNRCHLLYICKRWQEFLQNCRILLESNIYFITSWKDIAELMQHSTTPMGLVKAGKSLRRRLAKKLTKKSRSINGGLTEEQFFEFWKKSIFVMLNFTYEYEDAVLWSFSALLSSHIDRLIQPVLVITFRACLDAKLRNFTFDLARVLTREYRQSGQIWYAFGVMMNEIYQDYRHKRFCLRLWYEAPENINVLLMNGHIALANARYMHALAIYLMLYRMHTNYRYDSFQVALTYMHLICQNHTMDKCSLLCQMMVFFKDYIEKVGHCQETYYNLGRALHQLSFLQYASKLYRLALQTPLKVHDRRFDLRPEIAFNLSQIYRQSNDHRQANALLLKYCSI